MSAPAPLAAGDEFAAAVDALAEVASYANLAHVIAPNDDRAPSEWAAARANVLRLYAAAEARGRAAALAEVDAALESLDGPDDRVCGDFIAGRISARTVYADPAGSRPAPGDTWWASGNGPDSFGPTPTAAILAAAAALGGDA